MKNNNVAIDEILFMQTRLFRQFRERYAKSAKKANSLWNQFDIWNYIEECYDLLHVNGDEYILEDISDILRAQGAKI